MKHLVFLFSVVLVIFGCSSNNNGTVTVVPLAPTNLTGSTISTTQINLSWTDNATNEVGYKIERKTGSGSYAVIGSTATNLTTFNDLGLTPNTSYTYRVYAYNSAGNSVQYSNELTIATQDSIPSWLTNGLVAYYPFNGNANDESGNGNNGTVNGATLATDRFGFSNSSYLTNSNNQYIKTQRVIQNVSNTFTISLWANPQSPDIIVNEGVSGQDAYGKQTIIHPSHGSNWGDQSLNAGVGINVGTNQIDITEHTHLFIAQPLVYSTPTTLTGWHNIILIYNSHLPTLYVDGILVRTGLISGIQNIRPSSGFDIVYPNSGFGNSFTPNGTPMGQYKGNFDDIRIYNRALSASEVAYLASH